MKDQDKEMELNEETIEIPVENENNLNDAEGQEESSAGAEFAVEEQLARLQRDYAELQDKYIRHIAEFDNFKRRTLKERLDLMNMAARDTIQALLPALDDFDRVKAAGELPNSPEPFGEGIKLVYHKLYHILAAQGLEPMESNGQPFDTEIHEAITEIPAPSEDLKGKIIDTLEKGYKLKDKMIRYAKVVVGK
ncbi:MAG TPA: nucleotide exchange factor GrpE [Haliscomenobacter sp.]|uniref:nucleotide exchange factor GrpE n=1 Tax=Haliscomenobacter sp. TaxID=2717303 RepID=UPI002B5FF63D|nr:nucleotide exchange factor GrpE [Haliscomenobacter sp.]HOY17685.1 nucleotide exchange factor GrpE [Haliscomenobacter sp.]HPH20316.1 nucleotide exchange factor GrpE [Haliscomenobacter sp.]